MYRYQHFLLPKFGICICPKILLLNSIILCYKKLLLWLSPSPQIKHKALLNRFLPLNHCILKFNWNTKNWKSESVQEHFLASWNCVSYFACCLNAAANVLWSSSLHPQLSLQQWKIISLPPSTVALWSINLVSPPPPPPPIPPSISTYWEKRI